MIRVVLDTNVLVSGFFWGGQPRKILDAWEKKRLQLLFSQEIMEEYTRVAHVLVRKLYACQDVDVSAALELLTIHGEIVSPISLFQPVSRDPDDDKFIACALGGRCQLIISGDKDLLEISGYANITVLKPAHFVKNRLLTI
jgi:putative PIN family toxin of toxin-antitoxin system